MQQSDFQRFHALLQGMAKMFERELDQFVLDAYWIALKGWAFEDFQQASVHLMQTRQFMPRPFDFEALRKAGRATAAEAWEKARAACGSAIQCGQVTHNGTCGDELIDRAVRGIGGYGAIAMCETSKIPFLEKRFAEHYADLQEANDTREAVPQIAHEGHARRAIGAPTGVRELLGRLEPEDACR
jgi:hypothetical protein